ncbi:hypothetical protein ACHABQ_09845 [Nesterenkonia aurantiaca]|uniref:hypothetical protein n=1 Tax=Nesterenkonia aurantiaca TaxID=1436010 RepID=UPI003EE6555F
MTSPNATYVLVSIASFLSSAAAMWQFVNIWNSAETATSAYVLFGLSVLVAVALNLWLVALARRRRYDRSSV